MPDATVTAPSAAWLDEYRRERLARLERENDWLRDELTNAIRLLAACVVTAQNRRIDRLVAVLRDTAP